MGACKRDAMIMLFLATCAAVRVQIEGESVAGDVTTSDTEPFEAFDKTEDRELGAPRKYPISFLNKSQHLTPKALDSPWREVLKKTPCTKGELLVGNLKPLLRNAGYAGSIWQAGGSFGLVQVFELAKEPHTKLAVKEMIINEDVHDTETMMGLGEITALEMARRNEWEHVCQMVSFQVLGTHYWFAMDYYPLDLSTYIKNFQPAASHVVHIARGLITGLGKLHANGIMHNDFKEANVFLDWDLSDPFAIPEPYVGDLGASCGANGVKCSRYTTTAEFAAPEIMKYVKIDLEANYSKFEDDETDSFWLYKRNGKTLADEYSFKCDVYSLGMVFWNMIFREPSTNGVVDATISKYLGKKPFDLDKRLREKESKKSYALAGEAGKKLKQLLQGMLAVDPERRFDSAVDPNLLAEFDEWDKEIDTSLKAIDPSLGRDHTKLYLFRR